VCVECVLSVWLMCVGCVLGVCWVCVECVLSVCWVCVECGLGVCVRAGERRVATVCVLSVLSVCVCNATVVTYTQTHTHAMQILDAQIELESDESLLEYGQDSSDINMQDEDGEC